MVRSFRHRGLKRLYEDDDARRVPAEHAARLRRILTLLDVAERPADMDIPGFDLHPLKGDRKGTWSVTVSKNWRLTWGFDGTNAVDVDLEDYH